MSGLKEAWQGVRRALDGADVRFAIGGSWASTSYGEPRQTNDIDLIAAFTEQSLEQFARFLGDDYYFDAETAAQSVTLGRPFNVIHKRFAYKFDLFPVQDAYGLLELERRSYVKIAGLGVEPVPVVSAEDIVLAKLRWHRQGGGDSEQQWRDIVGVLRGESGRLDADYLEHWASVLGVLEAYLKARAVACS